MKKNKINFLFLLLIFGVILLSSSPSFATFNYTLGCFPARLMGYVNQGIQIGLAGDPYDTKEDYQSSIFQLLLENEVNFSPNFRFFGSVNFNADWAYEFLRHDSEWKEKQFNDAYDELFVLSHRDDIIKECHLTWTPGHFFFRLGKQIVSWGETDAFRIADQINPVDQRRGLTDVEFESTIIPIWLLKAEYFSTLTSSWMRDLSFEFVFNFNPHFRGNESIQVGNDKGGIWAPDVEIPLFNPPLPWPFDFAHLGSFDDRIDRPGAWDTDGFEYGFRIKSNIYDALLALSYFYGRADDPVTLMTGAARMETSPFDGRQIMHLGAIGKYPIQRLISFTFARDIQAIRLAKLGGVSPTLRGEATYSLDKTFVVANAFAEYDELRWAIAIDWKAKIRPLNETNFFVTTLQFNHNKIFNGYPGRDNSYNYTVMLYTQYFHQKLMPMVFYWRDMTQKGNMWKLQMSWEQDYHWNYTLGFLILTGDKTGMGFEPLSHKDHLYATIAYRF